MTREFEAAAETFGLALDDFEKITINAMKSAFLPYDQRIEVIYKTFKPGYARVRESLAAERTMMISLWRDQHMDNPFMARAISSRSTMCSLATAALSAPSS